METKPASDSLDLIWGAQEMARIVGCTERMAMSFCKSGQIPARKIGRSWVVERSKLIAVFVGAAA